MVKFSSQETKINEGSCLSKMAAMLSFRSVSALIVEPLKRLHSIPAFINLTFSGSLQGPTKLLSAFYSTPQTPISPPPSFETTPIARFLVNECGFSLHEAKIICMKKASLNLLGHKSYDNSRQTLLFLKDKGFDEIIVRKLFSQYPFILRCSFQNTVKPKIEFLEKMGFTDQKLCKALERFPLLFNLSISRVLEPRVCFLRSVLDPEPAAVVSNPESDKITSNIVSSLSLTASVILKNPRILSLPSANRLVGLVKDVEGMGIEKGSKAFARTFLSLSMLNSDTVKRKLEILRDLGFTEEEVGVLIKKMPTLLGTSEEKLRQTFKFLVEEWKLPRNAILGSPMFLCFSMEKRLKPRLDAVRALMIKNNSLKIASSSNYIHMSEEEFRRKVVGGLAA